MVEEAVEQAWTSLEKMIDNGFAVALRKDGRRAHVRAVRNEKVTEAEAETISEAVLSVADRCRQTKVRSKK